jgi:RNA polymerase sigma factor (sigma-70 family)
MVPRPAGLGATHRREFVAVYAPHARPGRPSADRVYGFVDCLYRDVYARRMTFGEFVSEVYVVLTGSPGRGVGLLNDFDPALYHGRKAPEDHFLNMLGRRLRARLRRRARAECLVRGPAPNAPPDRPAARRHGLARLRESLPEALATLDPVSRELVRRKYWDGMSDRQVGRALGCDHRTVARRHELALDRLRAFYREEVREWGREILPESFPKKGLCWVDATHDRRGRVDREFPGRGVHPGRRGRSAYVPDKAFGSELGTGLPKR